MADFNMGNYPIKDGERDIIKLIDEHNMEGYISKLNGKLIYSHDQQSVYDQCFMSYNFISYSMYKNYLYVLYYIMKNYPNIVNDYFHYESNDLWLKNHEDVRDKYNTSNYSHVSLIYYITSQINKTAVIKDDTNFYILLEILDLATDMPNVHYFAEKSRDDIPLQNIGYVVDHILFTLALFNYNSCVYKRIIYKLLCIDYSLMYYPIYYENYVIEYTKNFEHLKNYFNSLMRGYVSQYILSITYDNLHIWELIRNYLYNKERGNLIHLYDNKDKRIYIQSDNKLFDDNCLRWIYNTDDNENIGVINSDILLKIILWMSELIGYDMALKTIDETLIDIIYEDNKESDTINKEKNKSRLIWINMIKHLIMDRVSSDMCSLIILASDDFLKLCA